MRYLEKNYGQINKRIYNKSYFLSKWSKSHPSLKFWLRWEMSCTEVQDTLIKCRIIEN